MMQPYLCSNHAKTIVDPITKSRSFIREKKSTQVSYSAMFVWLISRTFSVNEHYFSLTTNQPTILSAMAYQPSEQDNIELSAT